MAITAVFLNFIEKQKVKNQLKTAKIMIQLEKIDIRNKSVKYHSRKEKIRLICNLEYYDLKDKKKDDSKINQKDRRRI